MSSERDRKREGLQGESGGAFTKILVVVLIVGLILVIAAFLYVTIYKVEFVIVNNGCEPFRLRDGLPPEANRIISILGVDLPDQVPTGGQVTLQLGTIPFNVLVDLRTPERIRVKMLGITVPASVSGKMGTVEFNGTMLSGRLTTVSLRGRKKHELVVTCK